MSCCSKEKMERNDCVNSIKSELTKSEREMFRVCPSKLSKRELEDLYFTLLENNLALKKTINKQKDKIRVLSTQVQRMTSNQEKLVNKEMKECCTGTKTFLNEQKVFITELKDTNRRLAERIQQLTMRLSSAKQFVKTCTPQAAMARLNTPFRMATLTPKKHDCLTKVQEAPQPISPYEPLKLSTFCQWEVKSPKKVTQTQISMPNEKSPESDQPCDANKCRTLMDELKLEIGALQEELSIVHNEYSTRISRLEAEVAAVRKENSRVSSERTASQHELQNTLKQNREILARFRKSEARCAELAAELSIEKRKVAELDTLLKAAKLSDRVNKTMEEHLITLTETLQGTVVAPEETDEKPREVKSSCPPSKVTDGVTADKNKLPEISKQKEVEDRAGGSSPTKYIMPSKSASSASKSIKVGTPTKTRSKDRKKQEHPNPPPKDLSPPPEDRKNLGIAPYPPSKDSSTRLEDRKNQEHPYPPPKHLCPRPEDGKNQEHPYPPPKNLPPRPEDRKNQEHPYPPPKHLSPRPEDRPISLCPCIPPAECKCYTDINPRRKAKEKEEVICRCPGWVPLTKPSNQAKQKEEVICRCPAWVPLTKPSPQDEHKKCKVCCYPDPREPDNDKVNSPRGPRTRYSPTKEINNIKSKIRSNTADEYSTESDEMALLKENKQLLIKILELQNKVGSVMKGDGLICHKCCKKDKPGATESPPSKNDKGLSTRGDQTRFSPTKDKDDTKSTNTADDSGYQESDETGLLTMNKELLLKISELQNQVDCMKMGMCQMSEAQSGKLGERQETPAKSTDPTVPTASINSPPLLAELTTASESSETELVRNASMLHFGSPPPLNSQSESEREIEKSLPFPCRASEEVVNRQKLTIEVLGNRKDSETTQTIAQPKFSGDTRAKTVQNANGTLLLPEDSWSASDEYMLNYDRLTDAKFKSPKLTTTEKKKLEVADSIQPDVSSKSGIAPGLAFNPEKLKYLENEGIIATADLENHQKKLEEYSGSITESVPSNPELGFGIPRLANKAKEAERDSGLAKTSSAAGSSPQRVRNDKFEILPSKLKLPMTETLAGNYPTATEKTDETKKEDCEYCAACSFDKECKLKHENALNPSMTKLAHGMQKEQIENHDLLNVSHVILDAIPTSDTNKKDKQKNKFSHLMRDMNRKQKTKSLTKGEMFANQKVHAQKRSITTVQPVNLTDVPLLDQRENCITNGFLQRQDSIKVPKKTMLKKEKSVQKQKKEDDFIEGSSLFAKHTCDTAVEPKILPDVPLVRKRENRELINDTTDNVKNYNQEIPMLEIKTTTGEARRVERTADMALSPEHNLPEKASQAITTTTNKAEVPCVSIRESARQRGVSMYRRASGTVCFRSVPVSQYEPACDCPGAVDGYCTDHSKSKGFQVQGDEAQKLGYGRDPYRQSTAERGTYTVGSNRAETPDTDLEMSYLPDLPLENEKKSPGKLRPLSPGEDRTTTHTSTTQDESTTARYSLSEGEMPPSTRRQSSIVIDKPYINPKLAHKLETPPSHQVEAALNAITDELQRCKNLLQANRNDELTPRASQTGPAPAEPRRTALKPALATQAIGNAHPPISIFTLHIGTVVLSDEAVLYSRNKNLVLKWKFYNQPVTIARMPAGRVVVFDFSTRYDITVTEDFLNYLKYEEMPIIICELGRAEQPFATATLPLRDALLLANTRADKSVVLLAGTHMRDSWAPLAADGASLAPQSRDEVGVIDLWCMLRADAKMVPGINLAIAQPGAAPKPQQHPNVIQHDYNELEIACRSTPAASDESTGKNQTYANVFSKYPPIRERTRVSSSPSTSGTPLPFAPLDSASEHYQAAPDTDHPSKMIINEVDASIKTPGDIVLAAGKNQRSVSSSWMAKINDDTISQPQGSRRSSLRSVLSRVHKRGSRVALNTQGGERNFIEKLRKVSANRAEQTKKVTIRNDENADDMEIEQPQRYVVQELKQKRYPQQSTQKVDVTVLWLALNEESEAMTNPDIRHVYVAYSFLGRAGKELETPVSLPKPMHYVEKCHFNFKKTFELDETDIPKIAHMARCRAGSITIANDKDCIVFSVVSEPVEDPLGIESCEDIGYAFLYLGDLLEYSAGSPVYTEVMPVRAARGTGVCGVLAVRVDGLDVVRYCQLVTPSEIKRPS